MRGETKNNESVVASNSVQSASSLQLSRSEVSSNSDSKEQTCSI